MQEIELESVHFSAPVREPRKVGYGPESQYFGDGLLPGASNTVGIFIQITPIGPLVVLKPALGGVPTEVPWHMVKSFKRRVLAKPEKAEKPAA